MLRHERELGEERLQWLYRKTGAPIHSAYALAQLRVWYKHNDSATEPTKARVVKWQTIASACLCRWTGVSSLPISFSEASWTGLLNIEACQYEPAMLDLLPRHCRDALPDLADFDFFTIAEAGTTFANNSLTLAGDYFDRWPALRSARLFLGIGDGACANIGSKCSIPTRIACTVGTSAAVRICLPRSIQQPREKNDDSSERLHSIMNGSVVKPGLFCYRIDRSHILVGGALTDGGSVVEWVSNLLKCPVSSVEFQQCLNEVKVLLEGDYIDQRESIAPRLPMMPFFSGERCTGFRSKATGAIAGLTLETTSAHLLKACLEGVTLRINAIAKLIVETTQQTSSPENEKDRPRIICSGKALEANILWRRMIADCTGLDVVWDEQTQEGTSRGVTVLLLAALNSGNISNAQETTLHYEEAEDVVCSDVTVPCQESERYWQEATRLQESLIDAVVPLSIYE